MNPDTQIILDELSKKFGEFETKLDSRFAAAEQKLETRLKESESSLESRVAEKEEHLETLFSQADDRWERRFADLHVSHEARVEALERAVVNANAWRPNIEDSLDHIRLEVNKLSKNWERALLDPRVPPVLPTPSRMDPRAPPVFPSPERRDPRVPPTFSAPSPMDPRGQPVFPTSASTASAAGRPPATSEAARPTGHHDELRSRDQGFGSITTILPDPAKGTRESPSPPSPPRFHGKRFDSYPSHFRSGDSASFGKLPKVSFPVFDGDNPRFWISRCENYFDMYHVDPVDWIRVSSMHLSSVVARWFQAIERKHPKLSWPLFTKLLHERFGQEQHQSLLRQMFRIKQTGSVADYISEFSTLVDQLDAYESVSDPLYFTTRFVDGLRDDIRAVVLVHRPSELDAACSLALLQEEVADPPRRKEFKKWEGTASARPPPRGSFPLPAPPLLDKHSPTSQPLHEDKRTPDINKSTLDKFANLKAYRRARGLCDKCAEKWRPGHQCAPSVQLHAVQELLELFAVDSSMVDHSVSEADTTPNPTEQLFLALSKEAVTGVEGPRTMKLVGSIQGHNMLVLVDSGSSHTFLSQDLADRLQGVQPLAETIQVQVANGQLILCKSHIPAGSWSLQGHSFSSDLKVLPLQHFDCILGMDWLELFSPMKVHWKLKWMSIPYEGGSVLLQGLLPDMPEELIVQVRSVIDTDLEDKLHPDIAILLQEFQPLFAPISGLPPIRACDHSIPLVQGAKPVYIRPYRYPPALKDEIEKQVQDLLDKGIIQHSNSPFSSPMLLVKKKDGSWRPCVDYRYLNALTIRGKFPIPIFDELVDELAGATWFSSLDLNSGFHQIRMKAGEEYKTAFQTHFGHFEFKVMSFGLCGAPGTFQGAMNSTLKPLLRKCVLVFFDDILVFSKSFAEHIDHLRAVFQLLSADQWQVKLSKCSFAQRQIAYLGHIISAEGISTDNSKVVAITTWPTPSNVKELRSFLGMAGYYRKFVHHFAVIAKPLTSLLKKNTLFVWTHDHQVAFESLKSALSSAPVLATPDFSKPFCIETDASAQGVGAVLMQSGHPLAFISKPLGPRTVGLSTYEKEYLAILLAVEQWRSYLQHAEFIICTDQKSLTHLTDQRLNTPWQQKVFTKLLGLQYKIVYKQGTDNRVADALSRRSHSQASLRALSACSPSWTDAILQGYSLDSEAQVLLSKLALDNSAIPNFTLKDGILRFKNRIWLGSNSALQSQVLSALHDSPVGGHSGFPVTYRRVKQLFAWKGMKAHVKTFVDQCQVCQQAKPDRSKYPGLLQPLPVPSAAWQMISMDFIEGLPKSSGKDCILVVVDRFTKYSHFIPLSHPFTAAGVAKAFFDNVYKLHGLPDSIVSDRDKVFTSTFWRELFKLAKVSLCMSSSYHPQTDGQTERVNQCLETFLRCFVHACPSKWLEWLSAAEFWYNTSSHSAIGRSPFVALYGYSPRSLGISPSDTFPSSDVSDWIQDRQLMNQLLQQHLLRAQQRMKRQADKHRSERSFLIGDWVYLKLQPYVQSSLAPRANQKLSFKFFGPFQILSKVGSVAYKLQLPANSAIHDVFHVSQLKKAKPAASQVSPSLPPVNDPFQYPLKILARKWISKGPSSVQQALIQWSSWPPALATWEDLEALRQRFPLAPAWGQAGPEDRGDVSTSASPEDTSNGPRRTTRPRFPSSRLSGPEWGK
ncbi:unnamed protein product [Urochloa humidicola]